MQIRILSSDWSISIQVPSKLKEKKDAFLFHPSPSKFFYLSFLYGIYDHKRGCKICIVYTGLDLKANQVKWEMDRTREKKQFLLFRVRETRTSKKNQ